MQEGHDLAYKSKNFRPHEKSYNVHDLELRVVMYALKIWRHYYLLGKMLTLSDQS